MAYGADTGTDMTRQRLGTEQDVCFDGVRAALYNRARCLVGRGPITSRSPASAAAHRSEGLRTQAALTERQRAEAPAQPSSFSDCWKSCDQ